MKVILFVWATLFLLGCPIPERVKNSAREECFNDKLPEYCVEGIAIVESLQETYDSTKKLFDAAKVVCEDNHTAGQVEQVEACKRGVDLVDTYLNQDCEKCVEPVLLP